MKKIMMISGVLSAIVLSIGLLLKFMHAPGASVLMVVGITSFSFIFLPLMFTLKIKEKQQTKDKVLLGLGSLVGILISLAILFKIMHWPGANMMAIGSIGLLILLYLPIHLVTGIRNPDTKVNTIVSSILLVAGCGLFLSLARSPQGSKEHYITTTAYYVRNNQLFQNEMMQFEKTKADKNGLLATTQIISLCEELKSFILEKETGLKTIGPDFKSKQAWLGENYSEIYFSQGKSGHAKLQSLQKLLSNYNNSGAALPGFHQITETNVIAADGNERVLDALNSLVVIELFVLQNERTVSALPKTN